MSLSGTYHDEAFAHLRNLNLSTLADQLGAEELAENIIQEMVRVYMGLTVEED